MICVNTGRFRDIRFDLGLRCFEIANGGRWVKAHPNPLWQRIRISISGVTIVKVFSSREGKLFRDQHSPPEGKLGWQYREALRLITSGLMTIVPRYTAPESRLDRKY
jgi:hypothetical protein